MPLITTQIGSHTALDALDKESPRLRDYLLAELDYKHSREIWKLLQPTNGEPSQRYVVQCLGLQEYVADVFGIATVFYRMHTLMAYLDEPNCLIGDVVASEALGDPAKLYNAQYINVPIELSIEAASDDPPLVNKVREYKRRIFDVGTGSDTRHMVVWERIE